MRSIRTGWGLLIPKVADLSAQSRFAILCTYKLDIRACQMAARRNQVKASHVGPNHYLKYRSLTHKEIV
jgi:hypothetical protein